MRLPPLVSKIWPYLAVALGTTGAVLLYSAIQPPLPRENLTIDCVQYLALFDHFRSGGPIDGLVHPFNTRPLVPFLASLVPLADPYQCFFVVNLVFTNAFFLLLWHVLVSRLRLRLSHVLVAFLWFGLHWAGVVRVYVYCPVLVDTPVFFLQALLLAVIVTCRSWWLVPLSAVATATKDMFWIYNGAMLLYVVGAKIADARRPDPRPVDRSLLPAVLVATAVSAVVQWIVLALFPASAPYESYPAAIVHWIAERLDNPDGFLRWMASMGAVYGCFPALALSRLSGHRWSHRTGLVAVLALSSVAASLGTTNMTRIIALGFPFVMTMALELLRQERPLALAVAFAAGLPLMRLASLLPIPEVPSSDATIAALSTWCPEWATLPVVNALLLYAVVASACVLWVRRALAPLPREEPKPGDEA